MLEQKPFYELVDKTTIASVHFKFLPITEKHLILWLLYRVSTQLTLHLSKALMEKFNAFTVIIFVLLWTLIFYRKQ
ncbi:hypothetical protein D9603_03650 [Pseudoalteromonas sp. PS5]|nr:hypothetical protein D9603_03650 [Pseudoalteromonas sp. PS5]